MRNFSLVTFPHWFKTPQCIVWPLSYALISVPHWGQPTWIPGKPTHRLLQFPIAQRVLTNDTEMQSRWVVLGNSVNGENELETQSLKLPKRY